ncbi:MAG: SufS family cysteine desulfurase [Phenylobacterium sp.]|uniref:aminotransferase class V-fold PLP-dependent enzyme n=1 Tax=Phenylobacterium sp. TaxID=1871053 RepID=UPI0025CDC39C|nr:cysteine desulfurase [Phenylobacterium sp.]MBI1197160.1 SufS family cysteine desulfurase [Phenylobacterium sp.]
MAFDAEAIRADFPILLRHVHGKPLVYLDSAASAQKPRAVIEAMSRAMEHSYANVHRGLHTLANETTEAYEGARAKAAAFIGAEPSEIVFTKGGTEAINLVASGLGRFLQPGDEIVLSEMEHHANIVPWHFLRERHGVVLKWVRVTDDGQLDLEHFQSLLGPRTRVVALSHMSNVLGTINDAKDLARMAHEAGALVLFDGCQAIVHKQVDVKDIDADFYVFSAHKLYGPTGIGVLYGKADKLAALPPYQGGGEMIGVVSKDEITYADPPHRFEAGTPPILEAIGLGAAIDWISALDRRAVAEHEHRLYARVREGLAGANWLKVVGEAPGKGAILSFMVDGAHAHDVAQILDRYGVAVRAGTHCAEPLMRRFGLTSSARASFALYNTEEEADAFVDALKKTQAFFA